MPRQTEVMSLLAMLRPHTSDFGKIRVGAMGDGGYVLPNDLVGISAVLSLGVGGDTSFDEHFADRGVPVYQYDPTVDGPPKPHDNFHFHKIAWGAVDDEETISLDGLLKKHDLVGSNDVLLKFDIEGGEWNIFMTTTAEVLRHFRIITCELHRLNGLSDRLFIQQIRQTLSLLTRSHTVVHLHANNCCGITLVEGVPVPAVVEVTLLRNDRSSSFALSSEPIPGPLDYPNMDDRPDIVLRPF